MGISRIRRLARVLRRGRKEVEIVSDKIAGALLNNKVESKLVERIKSLDEHVVAHSIYKALRRASRTRHFQNISQGLSRLKESGVNITNASDILENALWKRVNSKWPEISGTLGSIVAVTAVYSDHPAPVAASSTLYTLAYFLSLYRGTCQETLQKLDRVREKTSL